MVTIADYIYLNHHVNAGGDGAKPFAHLGDLDNSGTVDATDLSMLHAYYFYGDVSTLPWGDWAPWTSCVPTP